MRRRNFMARAGAAAMWPSAALTQQAPKRRGVFVTGTAASDTQTRAWTVEFERGLEELGWSQGRNIEIEYRWGEGDLAVSAPTQRMWRNRLPTRCSRSALSW